MRIALLGYGKMGKTVERIALEQDHQISAAMDIGENPMTDGFSGSWMEQTDVLIDFSVAEAVPTNVGNAVRSGLPIVVGTTGWYDEIPQVRTLVEDGQGSCIYSGNFSLGVQVLFRLTREAGKILSRFKEFEPFLVESHHSQKVDAPSGTAVTMQNILEESYGRRLPVASIRAGSNPGVHTAGFDSPVDTITLEHRARSRDGFARGAILAGQWIQGKQGFHQFDDVIFGEDHD
jgi:4-hydroxy-tetrahydrodipicolinate reductase